VKFVRPYLRYDLENAVELLVGERKEQFEFERAIRLMEFQTWIYWPGRNMNLPHIAGLMAAVLLLENISIAAWRDRWREGHVAEYVGLGLIEEARELRQLGPQLIGDRAPLSLGSFSVILRKRGRDEGGDDTSAVATGMRQEARRLMHRPLAEQHRWYTRVLRGHYGYFGMSHNWRALNGFLRQVRRIWFNCLRRRSQKNRRMGWAWFEDLMLRLPLPQITHPWTSRAV
jgi:hypothetical protein